MYRSISLYLSQGPKFLAFGLRPLTRTLRHCSLVFKQIKKKNDTTVLKYVEPKSALNPDTGGLVVTTYRDYDLEETSKLVRFVSYECGVDSQLTCILRSNSASRSLYGSGHDDLLAFVPEVHPTTLHPRSYGSQRALRGKTRCTLYLWQAR